MRINFINADLVPDSLHRSIYAQNRIFQLDLYTQLCLHSSSTPLIRLYVIYSKLYGQPSKQDPAPAIPTHPSTCFQTILAFFICRLEAFLTTTAANLSVQWDKTNPPVLHHVTLLDQSKSQNHLSV